MTPIINICLARSQVDLGTCTNLHERDPYNTSWFLLSDTYMIDGKNLGEPTEVAQEIVAQAEERLQMFLNTLESELTPNDINELKLLFQGYITTEEALKVQQEITTETQFANDRTIEQIVNLMEEHDDMGDDDIDPMIMNKLGIVD